MGFQQVELVCEEVVLWGIRGNLVVEPDGDGPVSDGSNDVSGQLG